jgi:ribosomal protein S6
VALASIKGIYQEIAQLNATAAYYRKHFELQESTISEQRLKLKNQDQVIHHLSVRIKRLWKMISNQILASHNTK